MTREFFILLGVLGIPVVTHTIMRYVFKIDFSHWKVSPPDPEWKSCVILKPGIYYFNNMGMLNINRVIQLAEIYGMRVEAEDRAPENICETLEMAERYLNKFVPQGFYFGCNEHTGDWGVYEISDSNLLTVLN